MISREILIQNKLGLHARAASKFVALAKEFSCSVEITSPSASADGKSIMKVLLLQATLGTTITISTDGKDEDAAMSALTELIDNKFSEEE